MKSAALWTLDQETIPAIPFREREALAAMQTRLDSLSLFRLLRKMLRAIEISPAPFA